MADEIPDPDFAKIRGYDLPPGAVTARWLRDNVATAMERTKTGNSIVDYLASPLKAVILAAYAIYGIFEIDKRLAVVEERLGIIPQEQPPNE